MSEGTVTRRSAVVAAAVVVVGGVAGYLAGRHTDAAKYNSSAKTLPGYGGGYRTRSGSGGKALAKVAHIPEGGGVILANKGVVITRTGSAVHAFSSTCTHQGCTVSTVANGTIDCPCHGSRFDVTTGKVVAGPAFRPLPKIAVTVRNGEVYST